MLQAIREKVTGWIAYGIIFLISIPFALWGVNSYLGGGEALPAATVNGEEISVRDLDQAYANYRQRLSQLFGGSIPESFGSEMALREQVLRQLIEEFSLRQYVLDQRYRIGDADLNRIIRNMDAFKIDGRFDTAIYESQLRSLGYSPLGFEQELRTNEAMAQFQSGILGTAFTLPVTRKQFTSLGNQTRKLRTLSHSTDPTTVTVGADEIERRYEAQKERYRTADKVKIDYIELSLDSVKQGIEVNADQVLASYQDNMQAYTTPEIREASHILLKADGDEQGSQALAKITEIRERIVNGESFADLAGLFSEDPGSAENGGSLGEIERGFMVQAFENELFSMQVDQLSEPVKTGFGWHLIKLHSISGGEVEPFEAVQADLEDEIRNELAEGQIYDLAENLANLIYEQSDSLLPAAEQLDLPLQTSDWFDRLSGSGIVAEQKVRQAAFSSEVMQQGLNSEAIELEDGRLVFIRLNEIKPAEQQSLDEVRSIISDELLRTKLREQNSIAGEAALIALNSGRTLDDLATEWSAEVGELGFIERNQVGIDNSIRSLAFRMPKPDQGLVYDGQVMANGDFVIVELSAILSNDENVDQKALDEFTAARGGAEYQYAVKMLSSRADVVRTPLEDL